MAKQATALHRLSNEELQSVRDTLQEPLTGRSVRVPLGEKAFFRGRLTPDDDAATSDESTGPPSERVALRMDNGSTQEMSRMEALEYVQTEIDKRQGRHDDSAKTVLPTKPSERPEAKQQSSSAMATAAPPSTPFFEIREELDDAGNEVRAEAINVSRHLEYLRQAAAATSDNDGESHDEDRTDHKYVPSHDKSIGVDADEEDEADETFHETEAKLPQPSDAEYQAVVARLDQLALLEEQAATEIAINKKSSQSLQSSGWSKGFLNKKKPAAEKTVNAHANQTVPMVDTGDVKDRPKSVVFQETNQVKEIPRIGERSVSSIAKPSVGPKPLDSSLFPGLVVEKTKPSTRKVTSTLEGTQQTARPSRFVQQRQELQQQQQHRAQQAETAVPLKPSRFSQRK